MVNEFLKIFTIQLVSLALCSANQNCSNNNCASIETINTFEMKAELDGKIIHLSWNFNSSEPIYGFSSTILSSNNSTLYQSPVLHSDERKMTINYELTNSEDSICLQVMKNQTEILAQKCEQVEASDLKMIIGILAGTTFIIPCIIVMGLIVYKDHHVRKLDKIADLIEEEQTDKLLCSQSIEESHDGSGGSCDNKAELEISHGDHVTSIKTNSNNVISDENKDANLEENTDTNKEDESAIQVKNNLLGETNLGFISEIPDDKKTKEKSQGGEESDDNTHIYKNKEVQTNVTIEDTKMEETNKRQDEIKKKEVVTLKIDIDLARKMAEADNEILEYSVHL